MKHKTNLAIFMIISLSLIFFACENENDQEDSLLNENYVSKIIETKQLNDLSGYYGDKEIFLEGRFEIKQPKENQLVFYTETDEYKHIFLFDGFSKSTDYLGMDVESLFYLNNGILLNKKYFLGTDDKLDINLKKDLNMFAKDKLVIENNTSNMLVYKWFSKSNPNYNQLNVDELINFTSRTYDAMIAGGCENGGPGSTGCSITSSTGSGCSVTCGSGYYACCNETAIGPNDCHCEKNKDR